MDAPNQFSTGYLGEVPSSLPVGAPNPVVATAILDSLRQPTRLLCPARSYPSELQGKVEFPGGKVEDGESWGGALTRELEEELGVKLNIGSEVTAPANSGWPLDCGRIMRVWTSELASDSATAKLGDSHSQLGWYPLDEIPFLDWLPSNRQIVSQLLFQLKTTI